MTQEEIQKKALEAYPKMTRVSESHGVIPEDYKTHYLGDANEERREGYIRALTEIEESPKISGWIARDAYEDVVNGVGLILHSSKPERGNEEWTAGTIMTHLPWSMFPDITWDDESIEVELLIRKI